MGIRRVGGPSPAPGRRLSTRSTRVNVWRVDWCGGERVRDARAVHLVKLMIRRPGREGSASVVAIRAAVALSTRRHGRHLRRRSGGAGPTRPNVSRADWKALPRHRSTRCRSTGCQVFPRDARRRCAQPAWQHLTTRGDRSPPDLGAPISATCRPTGSNDEISVRHIAGAVVGAVAERTLHRLIARRRYAAGRYVV